MHTMAPRLYEQYFIRKGDERSGLFALIRERYGIRRGFYPGSFVHITPSFHIPEMAYLDMDKRCESFFASPEVRKYILSRKQYHEEPVYRFHGSDFSLGFNEPARYFDILISLYSGFVSLYCKRYLRPGGIFLVNNSHGDASLAAIDEDFRLIGAVMRRNERFRLLENDLNLYFRKKDGSPVDREKVLSSMGGEGFTKSAWAYLFRKK